MYFPHASSVDQDISIFRSLLVNDYNGITTGVFLVYDYLLTFDREVELFWKRKFTGATALFFLNRYIPLLLKIFDLGGGVPVSKEGCITGVKSNVAIQTMQFIPWAVFSSLRAFALSRSWFLGATVLLLTMVPFGFNLGRYALGLTGVIVPHFGCITYVLMTNAQICLFVVPPRACLMIADFILIIITWNSTSIRFNRENGYSSSAISGVIWRNGTVYFIVLLVTNALHIALTILSIRPAYQSGSYVTGISEPLTAILVSRFLFDLQDANRRACDVGSVDDSEISRAGYDSLMFQQVIGSSDSAIETCGGE